MSGDPREATGTIFAVDESALHDGPGLRMVVYLKGCPLRCVWCHSPESRRFEPEPVWYEARCARCGACGGAGEAWHPECPQSAWEVKGETVTAGSLVDRALRLRGFLEASGGGVTLSGGEPTAQPEFAGALLSLLAEAGLHTAVETTGCCAWEVLERLLPHTRLLLFDLKHASEGPHRADTGVPLAPILANLRRAIEAGAEVLVRVPCIPGRNDSDESIAQIARVARAAGARRISLLPFNPAAPGKWSWVRQQYALPDAKPQSPARMRELQSLAASEGLVVVP